MIPLRIKIVYACGMLGWSILVNLIGVVLPYFFLPPANSGLINLIPQITIAGVFNLLAIITTSGRLVDALYDPMIGQLSDSSTNKRGRRIPFMMWSFLPAAVFCALVFCPLQQSESVSNAWMLAIMLILFFVSATTYIIPYNAMLPEMGTTSAQKIQLSTYQQVGFVIGMIIASAINNIADVFQESMHLVERIVAVQYSIWSLCIIGLIFMAVPIFTIDEKKYCKAAPTSLPIFAAIKQTLSNKNFRYYIFADFSYYMALYIITSGLLYFLTVLCGLPEKLGVVLIGTMVLLSLCFYPFINYLSTKFSKKKIVLFSFLLLAFIFVFIFYLGKMPIPEKTQMFILVGLAAFPLASLGILPPAILAEIAEDDAVKTGQNKEGLYFAVKYFAIKAGQTLGIAVFATLTIYGKDPGNDFGLRLNGIIGAILCIGAFVSFTRFREVKAD